MRLCIKTLLTLFTCYCVIGANAANDDFGVGSKTCLLKGEPCGIGVDGIHGAKCCAGTYCVSDVCKVLTPIIAGGNHPNVGVGSSNSGVPFDSPQEQQCKQRLKDAGCGHVSITALGPYCVCGCPDLVALSERFAVRCIPTVQDRIKLIGSCREYKNIQDCPQLKKQLSASPECLALKDQLTDQCEACGSRCTLLIEKSSGN